MAPPKFYVRRAAVAWIFITIVSKLLVHGEKSENCVHREKALLVALLALHGGENCDTVLQRGAQQIAALQLARDAVNSDRQDLPELEVKVFDTCSSSEQAVKATLKALVQAQQGCEGPLFLGLLGPEDADALRSVARVISVFHYPLVAPSAVRSFSHYSSSSVEISEPEIKAKGLSAILNAMNWKGFYLVFTPDELSTQTAASLLEMKEFCITQTVQQIPLSRDVAKDYTAYQRLLHALQQAGQQSGRVLVISEDSESATSLLKYLESVASKTKFLISVHGSGILPWRLPSAIANSTVIVHETSGSGLVPSTFKAYLDTLPLWNQYKNQTSCEISCEDESFINDATAASMTAAVHLFKEGLKTAQKQKCRPGSGVCSQLANMPPEEWKNILDSVSVVVKDEDGIGMNKLRFRMSNTNSAKTFVGNSIGRFEEVGSIHDGYLLRKMNNNLHAVKTSGRDQCTKDFVALPTEEPPATKNVPTEKTITKGPMIVDIFGLDVNFAKLGLYELIGVFTGLIFGMVMVIIVMICFIYRCFRVQTQSTYSSPSSTSLDLAPKSKKQDRRRFFKSSVKSIHTVQE